MRALAISMLAMVCVLSARDARADPFSVPVTLSTSGSFFCLTFAPCFTGEGTNQITIASGTDTATVTFTGVNQTFNLTNALSAVTVGQFSITASEGFTFPTNFANPELPIFAFRFTADGRFDSTHLFWSFGPGGGTTLQQFGPFNFGVTADTDPSPWGGVNFQARSPVLATNAVTDLTADAGLVPEPSTMILLGSGLAGLLMRRRRAA